MSLFKQSTFCWVDVNDSRDQYVPQIPSASGWSLTIYLRILYSVEVRWLLNFLFLFHNTYSTCSHPCIYFINTFDTMTQSMVVGHLWKRNWLDYTNSSKILKCSNDFPNLLFILFYMFIVFSLKTSGGILFSFHYHLLALNYLLKRQWTTLFISFIPNTLFLSFL